MKKFWLIITSIILLGAIIFGAITFYKKIDSDASRIYTQGLEDLKNNDLQNAYFNFTKVSKYSSLYEAALFRQGLIATELNDNDAAIMAYETLLGKFPNTFFAEKSTYNLAVAYYNLGLMENAFANFKLITKKYENSDYADASSYFLGVLTKDVDKKEAVSNFINYIEIAPTGRYSLSVIKELQGIQNYYSPEENLLIGNALLKNKKYKEALEYFNRSKFEDAWPYISITYKNTGNIKVSKKIFEDGITKYSKNSSEIQEEAIDTYMSSSKNNLNSWKNLKAICDKSKCQLNDYIMYSMLPLVDNNTKIGYYNRIYEEFSNGDYAADALFNSFFNDYLNGNYENAIIKAKKHIRLYSDKKSAPATMYWLARTYEKKGNTQEANAYYNKTVIKYNESYYAFLALSRINKVNDLYTIKKFDKIPEDIITVDFPILYANLPLNSSKKIDELVKIKDFKIFEYADFENEIIKSWVAYYEGDLAKASVISEEILLNTPIKPTFDDSIYKLIYPIGFSKEINKYSGEDYKIAPYLLLSTIRKESHFNTSAKSSTNASGLMQIMPDTASYIANLANVKYNKAKINEPEYNIALGVAYYNYIKKNYFKNDALALAAYNSGPGAVESWVKKYGSNNIDEFIERIPYQETKTYVKEIYQNYWAYSCIYNSSSFK